MLRPIERRRLILKDIAAENGNLIPELSEKYAVSEMTIRRDLRLLEDEGLIKRTWGGAILWPPGRSEPAVLDRERRQQLNMASKEAIAGCAAQNFVHDGDILIMEGGTTVTAMARYLTGYKELTIVTNGLQTAAAIQQRLHGDATIICNGGILRPESSTFVGPVAEQFFRTFYGRRLFLSGTGLSLDMGLTDPHMLEVQVKRAMIASADEVVILLDSSKFGVKSLMTVLEFSRLTTIITDEGAPAELLDPLSSQGAHVLVAPTS